MGTTNKVREGDNREALDREWAGHAGRHMLRGVDGASMCRATARRTYLTTWVNLKIRCPGPPPSWLDAAPTPAPNFGWTSRSHQQAAIPTITSSPTTQLSAIAMPNSTA